MNRLSRNRSAGLPVALIGAALLVLGVGCVGTRETVRTEGRDVPVAASARPAENLNAVVGQPSAAPTAPVQPAPSRQAPGACANPYFPLKDGLAIRYRVEAAGRSFEYAMKIGEVTAKSAKLLYSFALPRNFTVSRSVTCDDGAIGTDGYLDLGGSILGLPPVTTKKVVGSLLPADLSEGSAWTIRYDTSVDYGAKPGPVGAVSGTVEVSSRVLGPEEIEVPAGKFSTLKIQVETASTVSFPGSPTPPQPNRSTAYEWWADGIGLVKRVDAAGGATTVATRIVNN